jgi:hypothetical protein
VSRIKVADAVEEKIINTPAFRRKIWLDDCSPETQKEMLEIKQRWKAGKYSASRAHVAKAIQEVASSMLKRPVSLDAVQRWLQK